MSRLVVILALFSLGLAEPGRELPKRQTEEQCNVITANIRPLQASCRESTTACLTSTSQGFGTIPAIQSFICPPTKGVRENVYDVLVSCESQSYADQVYAGLCGSTASPAGPVLRCTDAILEANNGSAAKDACCGDGDSGSGSGSRCASELRRLADDLGCCTATIILRFFFENCGAGKLDVLLQENAVAQPQLCDYPLYTEAAGSVFSSSLACLLLALASGVLALV